MSTDLPSSFDAQSSTRRSGRSLKPSQRIRTLLEDDADQGSLVNLFPQYSKLLCQAPDYIDSHARRSDSKLSAPRPKSTSVSLNEVISKGDSSPIKCVTLIIDKYGRVTADVEMEKGVGTYAEIKSLISGEKSSPHSSVENNPSTSYKLLPLDLMLEPEIDDMKSASELSALPSDLDRVEFGIGEVAESLPGIYVEDPLPSTSAPLQKSIFDDFDPETGHAPSKDCYFRKICNQLSARKKPTKQIANDQLAGNRVIVDRDFKCSKDERDSDYLEKICDIDENHKDDLSLSPSRSNDDNVSDSDSDFESEISDVPKLRHKYRRNRKPARISKLLDSSCEDGHRCKICEFSFDTLGMLKKHSVVHSHGYLQHHKDQGFVTCLKCGLAVGNEESLKMHEARVHEDRIRRYMCDVCDKSFINVASYRYHLKHNHKRMYGSRLLPSRRASPRKTTLSLSSLFRRKKLYQPAENGAANQPEETIDSSNEFVATEAVGTIQTIQIICPKNAQHSISKKKHSVPAQLSCQFCELKFSTRSQLTGHKRKQHAEKRYKCRICADYLPTQVAVTKHLVDDHHQPMSKCRFCAFKSPWPQTIQNHERRVHFKEKNCACKHCDKEFFNSTELKFHEATHDPSLRVMCDLCGMEFSTKARVREHMVAYHIAPEEHKCPFCRKTFVKLFYLDQHIVRHTRLGDHICKVCKIDFCTKYALSNHMKTKCSSHAAKVNRFKSDQHSLSAGGGEAGRDWNSFEALTPGDEAEEIMRMETEEAPAMEEGELPLSLISQSKREESA